MEINARDLSRLIELNKKKAELEFQQAVLGLGQDKDLALVCANAKEIEEKAKAARITIVAPWQNRLDELGADLAKFTPDAIREGMKMRDGLAYQTLRDRGTIVKKNFENRLEIAKISILLARMGQDEAGPLSEAIASGSIESPINASSLEEGELKRLAKFLRRCGIQCVASGDTLAHSSDNGDNEVRIQFSNRNVWVSESAKGRLENNLSRIQNLNAHIQLKNAERQIKTFDEQEEKLFASLQQEFLDLLKEQDELLRDFNDEERISVRAPVS